MNKTDAIVITPTTGADELKKCIESVRDQTYPTHHLIVMDGKEYQDTALDIILSIEVKPDLLDIIPLPFNTGRNGFYGHRILASIPHLLDHKYILFLDQDNWYDEDHVESLIRTIEHNGYEWAHSYRTIVDKQGNKICVDECESLGKKEGVGGYHLVDTSSYCFTNEFIRMTGHIWDHGWGADRRYYQVVTKHIGHKNFGCSGFPSLNYRLGGNDGSVKKEFFEAGNAKMKA